jgi:hypothetical protein
MSPEQCAGAAAGPASDVYSLGVIAYEMLAGEPPFKGDPVSLLMQHLTAERPLPARATPEIGALVARAMAKDPGERPASAGAFATALRARTVAGGQVIRRAVAVYSEHLPAFLRLSLFSNTPIIAVGAAILALIPFTRVGVAQALVFLAFMLLGVMVTYGINRATFALVIERLRARPLSPLEAGDVFSELSARLGGGPVRGLAGYAGLLARAFTFVGNSPRLALWAAVPVRIVEGAGRREANARSLRLFAEVPAALRSVGAFGMVCYAVPILLFFLSALGVTQALGMDRASAVSVSFGVAVVATGMNLVWLIPPAHVALVMLYFVAREAAGERVAAEPGG